MLTYNYTQTVPSTTWVVTHNFGTPVIVTDAFVMMGGVPEKILPLNVVITDSNTLTVTFSTNETGVVRVVSG
jgi:hypothetical protein